MGRHTTVTGRIVYDRPRHFFQPRDLSRIARTFGPPTNISDGLILVGVAAGILLDTLRAIVGLALGTSNAPSLLYFWRDLLYSMITPLFELALPESTRKKLAAIQDLLLSL